MCKDLIVSISLAGFIVIYQQMENALETVLRSWSKTQERQNTSEIYFALTFYCRWSLEYFHHNKRYLWLAKSYLRKQYVPFYVKETLRTTKPCGT